MKNCVVFNDLSGYGNCSLMAAIPVLTVMGVRVHPVPTAVLTRQTGYDRYSMEDLTGFMPNLLRTGKRYSRTASSPAFSAIRPRETALWTFWLSTARRIRSWWWTR